MKVKLICIAISMVFIGASHAQVRKCIGPDGKVTYSDSLCASQTVKETGVRTDVNTIDTSGFRQEVADMKGKEAVDKAMQSESGQCKFSYFSLGDSLGQELAKAAKKECLDNIAAKATGASTSKDAYERWKDHYAQQSSNRNAAVARAEARNNARATANAINQVNNTVSNKTYSCKSNLAGSALDCK